MFKKSLNKFILKLKNECGAGIIEFLVALGLVSTIITAGLELLGPSIRIEQQSQENEQVASLIQEHFEIIRSIRNEDWNALFPIWPVDKDDCTVGVYHYIDEIGEEAGLSLTECPATFGKYLVSVTFADVYRDAEGNILVFGTVDQIDSQTRQVTVTVEWDSYGRDKEESKSIYLTNWGGF